jgi:hypothetical protein
VVVDLGVELLLNSVFYVTTSNKNLLLFLGVEALGFLRIESEGGDSVKGYRPLARAYWTSLQCSKSFGTLRLCCEIGHGSPMGAASSPALRTRPFGCHKTHAQAVRQQGEGPRDTGVGH